ncbi:MAG: glycosyltransferase [Clostridiaceae bacterium]|jgi:glycosyltransferase involved in cell wall biosynthesis|nr:glycosyltransferase [Clostridiaceae bacterium]
MRIGYVTMGNCIDKKLWSGTIFSLYEALCKDYEVENIQVPDSKFLKLILFFLNKTYSIINQSGNFRFLDLYAKIKSYQLSKQLKKGKYDILFVPIGSTIISYVNHICPIIYLSDTTFNLMVDYYFFNLNIKEVKIGNKIEKYALKNADFTIVPSSWAQNDILEYYKIDSSRCKIIPFGSNITYCSKIKKSIENNVINLLTVGVEWERKGIQCAIECVNYLNKNYHKIFKLSIIGIEKPKNFQNDNVNFCGFLNKNIKDDYSQLIDQYKMAHFFILPTRAECAGIVFAEASMFSLPILSYKTGGVPTYVRNNINGYCLPMTCDYKDFASKVMDIIETSGLYEKLSNGARALYEEELNWDAWRKEFNIVVNDLLLKDREQ